MTVMYEQNDILVYGNNGVCRLVDIRRERFGGAYGMYYILAPLYDSRSRYYVPVGSDKLKARLRPVMEKGELDGMMNAARGGEAVWEPDDRKREHDFHEIVSKGLSEELIGVMRTLLLRKRTLMQDTRRLRSADEKVLSLCEKIVSEEYACAFGVDVGDALSYIRGELLGEPKDAPC